MDLHTPDLQTSRGLEVLLPGIYEEAEVHIYYHNYAIGRSEDQLIFKWQDKRIIQRVNTSLLLNGKQYYIFSENINQRKVYSWQPIRCHRFSRYYTKGCMDWTNENDFYWSSGEKNMF